MKLLRNISLVLVAMGVFGLLNSFGRYTHFIIGAASLASGFLVWHGVNRIEGVTLQKWRSLDHAQAQLTELARKYDTGAKEERHE